MAGQLDAMADLSLRVHRLEELLQQHHEAGVLPAHLAGQTCSFCDHNGYFQRWPEPMKWQPVTLVRTH